MERRRRIAILIFWFVLTPTLVLHYSSMRKVDLVEEGQLKDFAVSSVDRDKILVYEREA